MKCMLPRTYPHPPLPALEQSQVSLGCWAPPQRDRLEHLFSHTWDCAPQAGRGLLLPSPSERGMFSSPEKSALYSQSL